MKRITLIVAVLAFCLPVRAEILIFKTSITGQQFEAEGNIVEQKKENGYFVINTDLSNTSGVTISEAYHLHYETRSGNKIQYTSILDTAGVEIILIDNGKAKKMVLRYFDESAGKYMVLYGTAASKDIGGLQRYVPSSLSGHAVWREVDFKTGSGIVKFKLDLAATKLANTQARTAIDILDEYEQMLETKGYDPQ